MGKPSPEEIAAALERWDEVDEHQIYGEIWVRGEAMARLLRESQPACPDCGGSGGVEYDTHLHLPCACSQPEPAAVVGDDAALLAEATDFCDRYGHKSTGSQARTLVRRLSARIRSQRYHCTECGGTGRIAREASDADDHLSGSMDTPLKSGDKPCPYCEPEILKEAGDALENWPTRNMRDVRDLVINLCGSLRAALADVARLTEERDGLKWQLGAEADDSTSIINELRQQRDEARAALIRSETNAAEPAAISLPIRAGFVLERHEMIAGLVRLRERLCRYSADPCDCKYGASLKDEESGCPEVRWAIHQLAEPVPSPEPAAPAVGEADLIARLDAISLIPESSWSAAEAWTVAETCREAIARINALLAEVARLTEERERSHVINRAYRQSAHDSAANFRKADVERLEMRAERDKALATLAAVRKVAENYNNVDFVGDGRIEMTTNPCAAEILNVLEGKP